LVGLSLVVGLVSFGSIASRASTTLPPMGWSQTGALPSSFTTRWDFSDAYMPSNQSVVLFGGSPQVTGDDWYNDTWIYANKAWTKGPAAPAGLTPRGGAAMAYDPDIDKVVLFGGQGDGWPQEDDTWLWDGTSWSPGPATPAGMAGRTGAEMVYDPDIGKIVLFGGSGTAPYNDTWLFNGTSWTQGPAAPAGMLARAFFGMTYDPALGVVVNGGDGTTETWLFDGTAWSPGPSLPDDAGPLERVRLAYDPDLSATILFGGMALGGATSDAWMLSGGVWDKIGRANSPDWPGNRLDPGLVWNADSDALMVFSGVMSTNKGRTGYRDAWFFRDSPPAVSSLTLSPDAPDAGQTITADVGGVTGGFGTMHYDYDWYKNGVLQSPTKDVWSKPDDSIGDVIKLMVQVHDSPGVYGPWVSATVIVGGGSIDPNATVSMDDGTPGSSVHVSGTAFGPTEEVDLYLGSPGGTSVGSATTDGSGNFSGATATLPDVIRGGEHDVYAVGQDSGIIALGSMSVVPEASVTPTTAAAGDTLTYSGDGFLENGTVTIAFPDGTSYQRTANSSGVISTNVTMPALPAPSATITGTATNGTTTSTVAVSASMSLPGSAGASEAASVEINGLQAGETVQFSFDAGSNLQTFAADSTGTVDADVVMPDGLGWHVMHAHAMVSDVDLSGKVLVTPGVTVSPGSGKPGTVVTITSGPGWVPGETLTLVWRGVVTEATLTADADGSISTTFTIPSHVPGAVSIELNDDVLSQTSTTYFTVKS
jgi:hypothetical protein